MSERPRRWWIGLPLAVLLAVLAGVFLRGNRSPSVESSGEGPQRHPSASVSHLRLSGLMAAAPAAVAAPPLLFGTVRSESGEPIAQAQVCVSCAYPECGRIGPPKTSCVSSGARGEYTWPALAPGSYRLAASAVGFEPGLMLEKDSERTVVRAGASLRRDLILRPGGASLAGTVVDATGGPIPLARVQAMQSDGAPFGVAVLSDEGGHFSLSLRAGDVTVRAEADGYASAARRTSIPDTQLELQLSPEASLSGTVVSALDGHPLADIEVTAFKHTPLMLVDGDGRTFSTGDGSFSIRGLSSGTYHVHARSSQWAGAAAETVSLAISEPGGPVRIEAHPAVVVAGGVQIAGANAPCPAGTVFIGSDDAAKKEPFAASSAIAAEGAFRFAGVPAGAYTLRVECRDTVPRSYPTLRVAEKDVGGLKLEVDSGGTLTGRVVDTAGRGLADRAVFVEPHESVPGAENAPVAGARVQADAQGKFSVKGLAPGVYHVSAGDERSASRRVELTAGHASADVTLVIAAGGALRILVEAPDERARATVSVSVSSQFGEQPAQRAGDGSYRVRDLRAGLYTVSVSDGRGPGVSQKVQLAEGQEVEARLVMPKQHDVLSGRVVDSAGNPVSDAWVTASRSAASSLYEGAPGEPVLTDADGNFELTQLARSEAYDVEAYITQGAKIISRGLRPGQRVTLRLETNGRL